MAQYCEIAGKVTNCTDNCKVCLEEEAKTREIEVGDKVMKNTYEAKKEIARQEAIDWQNDVANRNYSYGELCEFVMHFEKLGRRYGLLKEFRENGIC